MKLKIAIGTDHRGFELKQELCTIKNIGMYEIEWIDCGAHDEQRSDYPVFARAVCEKILSKTAEYGVLICGSGIGMAIAANRFKGIRAGLVWNDAVARSAKEDDDCNVLVFAADSADVGQMKKLIRAWLEADFKAGRYTERVIMLDQ